MRRGVMMRAGVFLIIALVAIAALAASEREANNAGLPLVKADYQQCVTVEPPPLLRTPQDRVDYRLGQPFNDKGVS
jgi:hypothetical protein